MLGSYAEFDKKSSQYKWLVADLAKIDRKKTPWVIVLLHAPWYSTNTAHQGEGDSMRKAMEELLYNARVDVVFAGHVHAYERFVSQIFMCGCVRVLFLISPSIINSISFIIHRLGFTTTRRLNVVHFM